MLEIIASAQNETNEEDLNELDEWAERKIQGKLRTVQKNLVTMKKPSVLKR